jgi:hypothetical protein
MSADFGVIIAMISVITGVCILGAAAAGAYFFGKSRAQKEALGAGMNPELITRLARVEQIVEATAIEVERISEGQRFTSRLLSEKKAVEQ